MRQAFAGISSRTIRCFSALPAFVVATAIGIGSVQAAQNPKHAAIVVDASTGRTLFEENADRQRFPASLTKMMTLYLTFEAMKAGKITKNTRVPFSAQAAAKPPTKIGVKAGNSVTVETAILSLVTKSANDAATALGELLGGSEQRFALLMTQKARRLGMSSTVFQNANGLPDPDQHTTARDMATLGLALRADFPQYYPYFSTPSFTLGRQRMPNHNRLLGRIKGVDGIKTGYTNASGFNLVSSVVDGDRRIVAVVMGGRSGRSRDDYMAGLIKKYLPKAVDGNGALVASVSGSPRRARAETSAPAKNAPAPVLEAAVAEADVVVAEDENVVTTTAKSSRVARAEAYAAAPVRLPVKSVAVDPIETASIAPKGWAVQVASSPSETEARAFLQSTTAKAGSLLASASGYTVPFKKSGTTFYRARFGGFASKDAAWDACAALKKKKVSCYAVQQ